MIATKERPFESGRGKPGALRDYKAGQHYAIRASGLKAAATTANKARLVKKKARPDESERAL